MRASARNTPVLLFMRLFITIVMHGICYVLHNTPEIPQSEITAHNLFYLDISWVDSTTSVCYAMKAYNVSESIPHELKE